MVNQSNFMAIIFNDENPEMFYLNYEIVMQGMDINTNSLYDIHINDGNKYTYN